MFLLESQKKANRQNFTYFVIGVLIVIVIYKFVKK